MRQINTRNVVIKKTINLCTVGYLILQSHGTSRSSHRVQSSVSHKFSQKKKWRRIDFFCFQKRNNWKSMEISRVILCNAPQWNHNLVITPKQIRNLPVPLIYCYFFEIIGKIITACLLACLFVCWLVCLFIFMLVCLHSGNKKVNRKKYN